jgi:hypothetical protein
LGAAVIHKLPRDVAALALAEIQANLGPAALDPELVGSIVSDGAGQVMVLAKGLGPGDEPPLIAGLSEGRAWRLRTGAEDAIEWWRDGVRVAYSTLAAPGPKGG